MKKRKKRASRVARGPAKRLIARDLTDDDAAEIESTVVDFNRFLAAGETGRRRPCATRLFAFRQEVKLAAIPDRYQRLSEDEARSILLQKGRKTQVELAREFGVIEKTISLIHRGVTWKHFKEETK